MLKRKPLTRKFGNSCWSAEVALKYFNPSYKQVTSAVSGRDPAILVGQGESSLFDLRSVKLCRSLGLSNHHNQMNSLFQNGFHTLKPLFFS